MFDLNWDENEDFGHLQSHPGKPLRVHITGVCNGISKRTNSSVAIVAGLFHDLGKLNPNFIAKLGGVSVSEYSNHAYLSAAALISFLGKPNNRQLLQLPQIEDVFAVIAIIAKHHGNLPNMRSIFAKDTKHDEITRLRQFLVSNPTLPISNFLQNKLKHVSFDVNELTAQRLGTLYSKIPDTTLSAIANRLEYFQKTQFAFSCLLEADKRDAGNNKWFNKEEQLIWAKGNFKSSLSAAFAELNSSTSLNIVRTSIREEAVQNIEIALSKGERVFSLTSPTGSGKTLTLLALADTIRDRCPDHAMIYNLPFLSITEQVEDVSRNLVFKEKPSFVTRIDSRSENKELDQLLKSLENDPSKIDELLSYSFSMETFDAAFIVTTFVQFFETLLSNRGATLLRLPNFSKCIFLIDEIQALPPRLYVFFAAYLSKFCQLFDSYAVLSTATMPALCLPDVKVHVSKDPKSLFLEYKTPTKLISFEKYYSNPVFNRYLVERLPQCTLETLANIVRSADESCLIILNTIEDTRNLYQLLHPSEREDERIILLNTHFILDDRRQKIEECKTRLENHERTILISTQLIEAGVDIDFPYLYRDLCPLPNLIQSAGRCNRNGKLKDGGVVRFFELVDDQGNARAEKVYREQSEHRMLDFSRQQIQGSLHESSLLEIQRAYFDLVNSEMLIGGHKLIVDGKKKFDNLIGQINEIAFETVGSFRLIDKDDFGEDFKFYVPHGDDDEEWEELGRRVIDIAKASSDYGGRLPFAEMKKYQLAIDDQLRRMSGRVVQVRAFNEKVLPPSVMQSGVAKEICGLRKLLLPDIHYSSDTGIKLNGSGTAII